jgi:hypothetical protein
MTKARGDFAPRFFVSALTYHATQSTIRAEGKHPSPYMNRWEETMVTKLRIALAFAGLFLLISSASAQTKITGTIQCAKPEQQSAIPVNDQPGHAFVVMKAKCTWTKPLVLAGIQTKTGEDTVFAETMGASSHDAGYHISTMVNADTFVVKFTGTSTTDKNGMVLTQTGTWSFLSGTGKMKGVAGKGTYNGKGAADGSVTTAVEGEYQIAAK